MLFEDGYIFSDVADKSKKEYKNLLLDEDFLKAAKEFSISDRVDGFFRQHVKNDSDIYKSLKLILILSHGNGRVEGGFSINKSISLNGMRSAKSWPRKLDTIGSFIQRSGCPVIWWTNI